MINLKVMKKLLLILTLFLSFSVSNSQTTFKSKVLIANTGDQPYRMVSGDFNSDGNEDLIITTFGDNTIELYSGDGNGGFSLHASLTNTLSGITEVDFADLNGDTHEDIVVCSYNDDKVVWFANDAGGNGNFGTEQTISSSIDGASGLTTGTIDGGSSVDIIVSAFDGDEIFWFSNDGTGSFTGPTSVDNTLTGPGAITLKDLDGDTDLDAVVTTSQSNSSNVVQIFRNNGAGSFTKDASPVASGLNYVNKAKAEDVDGDTNLDILVPILGHTPGIGSLVWYEDNGAGFTANPITTSFGNPAIVEMADLDDDGLKDMVVSSGALADVNDLIWFKNNGSGSFGSEQVIDNTQGQAYSFVAVDFDNDGDLDIASNAYADDQLNWFENEKYPILGISDNGKDKFRIYPNPSTGTLNFKSDTLEHFNVSVYNILGAKVLETIKNSGAFLDVSNFQSGVYILRINSFNNTYKFIKK